LDTTGIVNIVCRHDIPIKTGQLRHAGERYGYALYMLLSACGLWGKEKHSRQVVGWLYDISSNSSTICLIASERSFDGRFGKSFRDCASENWFPSSSCVLGSTSHCTPGTVMHGFRPAFAFTRRLTCSCCFLEINEVQHKKWVKPCKQYEEVDYKKKSNSKSIHRAIVFGHLRCFAPSRWDILLYSTASRFDSVPMNNVILVPGSKMCSTADKNVIAAGKDDFRKE
jgi:hypothetical protein